MDTPDSKEVTKEEVKSTADSFTQMQAAYLTEWLAVGTVPETISFGKVPVPKAGKNQVIIDIKASALNVDDVALCQNSAGGGWFFHARTPSVAQPLIGGIEYAGVVSAVGPGCKILKVGDRVCGLQDIAVQQNPGTWAEQTMAPENHVVKIPTECKITYVEAASVCMGAYISGDLFKRADLPVSAASCRVLVIGASGGLGTILLKLLQKHKETYKEAKLDLHITAVCSGSNSETVRRLGADETVDYKTAPFHEQLVSQAKFDVVFDFVGGEAAETGAKQVITRGGKFITACGPMAGVGDRILTCGEWYGWACGLLCRILNSSCCCCFAQMSYEMGGGMPPLSQADFDKFVVEQGIRAEVALEVSFTEEAVREALRRVASRHTGGKVVINMEKQVN